MLLHHPGQLAVDLVVAAAVALARHHEEDAQQHGAAHEQQHRLVAPVAVAAKHVHLLVALARDLFVRHAQPLLLGPRRLELGLVLGLARRGLLLRVHVRGAAAQQAAGEQPRRPQAQCGRGRGAGAHGRRRARAGHRRAERGQQLEGPRRLCDADRGGCLRRRVRELEGEARRQHDCRCAVCTAPKKNNRVFAKCRRGVRRTSVSYCSA